MGKSKKGRAHNEEKSGTDKRNTNEVNKTNDTPTAVKNDDSHTAKNKVQAEGTQNNLETTPTTNGQIQCLQPDHEKNKTEVSDMRSSQTKMTEESVPTLSKRQKKNRKAFDKQLNVQESQPDRSNNKDDVKGAVKTIEQKHQKHKKQNKHETVQLQESEVQQDKDKEIRKNSTEINQTKDVRESECEFRRNINGKTNAKQYQDREGKSESIQTPHRQKQHKNETGSMPVTRKQDWPSVGNTDLSYPVNEDKQLSSDKNSWESNFDYKNQDPYSNQRDSKNFKQEKFNRFPNRSCEKKEFTSYNKRQPVVDKQVDNWRSINKSDDDKGFCQFMDLYNRKIFDGKSFIKVSEIQEDLFQMPTDYSLAHCVAEDMNMGSGIAVQFSQQFKRRDELYMQRQKQGGLAVLEDKGRYIYYLVTKRQSNGKPTQQTMWNSLQKLQNHMFENKVKKLAIPRIGCGLDRLEWSEVKAMLEYTFKDTDVAITVCNFQQVEEDVGVDRNVLIKRNKCFVKNERYPISDIESGTAIIYFGTENGFISDDIKNLDKKFGIIMDYRNAKRQLGNVIHAYKKNDAYSLYGFIVRKTEKDEFDFIHFHKCINQLKKINKDHYFYVAFQAFLDKSDDLLMIKIVNMLKHSLLKNEIYVCWGGDMISFMPQERQNTYS